MAKEFLSKENAEFEDFNVMEDREALAEMVKVAGVRTVPVIVGCNEIIIGFDKDKLAQMVNCIRNRTKVEV